MDKNKEVIVVSMAEKRKLEAHGFTNIKLSKDKEIIDPTTIEPTPRGRKVEE